MNNVKEIFNNKIFRIPDYQRGYSWETSHLNDFWQDLNNLHRNRIHYTGMISVERVQKKEYSNWTEDLWIIEGKNDTPYFIVDGQQRLTTIIILIWAILDQMSDGQELSFESREEIQSKYIFTENPKKKHKSYIFGYHKDNPSYEFLKQEIFEQPDSISDKQLEETAYTNNLLNAKKFFLEKINGWNLNKLEILYDKVTKKLMFDFKILEEELDIFIVFETMNNRGKPLSNLEKLKNRLIYLSTLLKDTDDEQRKNLREKINEKWKTIYKYLGLNKERKLDDDLFLQSHWIMYMRYDRREPEFYASDIFEKYFTIPKALSGDLNYSDIDKYISSIASSAKMWFVMNNPNHRHALEIVDTDIILWLKKQNRVGYKAFAPLILAAFTRHQPTHTILHLLKATEAYIFLIFNVSNRRSNTGTYHFNALANQLYIGELSIQQVVDDINLWIYGDQSVRGYFDDTNFYTFLKDLFLSETTNGYYDWKYLRYFLFEYEIHLNGGSEEGLDWNKLKYIHYIMPKAPVLSCWKEKLKNFSTAEVKKITGSLGNFTLSSSRDFEEACFEEYLQSIKVGSNMAKELLQFKAWGINEIIQRGLKILSFMEDRWNIKLGTEEDKKKLLFIDLL